MHPKPKAKNHVRWIVVLILIAGCDDRATQIALEAANRQAQQNTTMAELHDEVAGGTRRLVEADSHARAEIVAVHRDLQAERFRLDTGWTSLEQERREIAHERRTESILVPAIEVGGGLALVIVLLGYCWYALVRLRCGESVDADLSALLVEELLADGPPDLLGDAARPAIVRSPNVLPKPN